MVQFVKRLEVQIVAAIAAAAATTATAAAAAIAAAEVAEVAATASKLPRCLKQLLPQTAAAAIKRSRMLQWLHRALHP